MTALWELSFKSGDIPADQTPKTVSAFLTTQIFDRDPSQFHHRDRRLELTNIRDGTRRQLDAGVSSKPYTVDIQLRAPAMQPIESRLRNTRVQTVTLLIHGQCLGGHFTRPPITPKAFHLQRPDFMTLQDNPSPTALEPRLSWALLLLRCGVGLVFFMWTLDKFLNPEHAALVWEKYYMMKGLGNELVFAIGIVQMLLVVMFVTGTWRTVSYALITGLHTVSTLSAYKQYMNPWEKPNLLFYAAWPMLAACVALWLLRDYDRFTVDEKRS